MTRSSMVGSMVSSSSARPLPTARGYALVIVLMVLTLMAIALGSMAWLLDATIAEGRRTVATIRVDLACASALDLASRTIGSRLAADPSTDPRDLTDAICALGACDVVDGNKLPRFLAPAGATLEHFSISFGSARGRTTRPIASGPFAGRTALEQVLMVTVVVRDDLTQRPCGSTDRYVIPSLPLMSFPLFATAPTTRWSPPLAVRRVNDGAASSAHLNGNGGGTQISASDFVLPGVQFAGDKDPIALGGAETCRALTSEIACLGADCGWDGDVCRGSTRGSDQVLAPAVGTPSMSAAQSSLTRSLRWLVEPPKSTDSKALGDARLAEKADIVIIDGVWYNNRDKSLAWPGKPIWSDRPGRRVTHVAPTDAVVASVDEIGMDDLDFSSTKFPKLFSWYDRDSASTTIRSQSSGGVLSYGPLAVLNTGTSCISDADCGGFECFRPTGATGSCQRLEPGLWPTKDIGCGDFSFKGVSQCSNVSDVINGVVDGARSGFRDGDRNILPINLNLATLAAALQATDATTQKYELGWATGGPAFFNGVIYITSRFTGSLPEPEQGPTIPRWPPSVCTRNDDDDEDELRTCPGSSNNAVHRPRSVNALPVGLCGGSADLSTAFDDPMPCDQGTRPNAVRIYNGTRLPAAIFPKGLTIATDLPLYVQGDLNRVIAAVAPDPAPPHTKVALVADRVTFLSRGWRDELHPWNNDAITSGAPATGAMVVEASLISGLPRNSDDEHDLADLFRTPQTFDDNHFVLRGHLVAGFNSELETRSSSTTRVGRGLRWLPDYHLNNPGFQPPGMPLVTLPPSSRWRQR